MSGAVELAIRHRERGAGTGVLSTQLAARLTAVVSVEAALRSLDVVTPRLPVAVLATCARSGFLLVFRSNRINRSIK